MFRNFFNEFNDLRFVMDRLMTEKRSYLNIEEPLFNISENDETIKVQVLAPGVKSENIDLNVTDNILEIKIKKEKSEGDSKYLKRERTFGNFTRSVKLPYRINNEEIKANLKDGILHIELSRSEDSKPKKITIQ